MQDMHIKSSKLNDAMEINSLNLDRLNMPAFVVG